MNDGDTGNGRGQGAPVLSVVVPTYRQETTIADNLGEIVARVDSLGIPFEVVVVSDGSPDATELRALEVDDPRVHVMGYDRNMGKGYALRTGSLAARGAWIAWVDSDLDLDPAQLGVFLEMAEREDLEIVVGSKRHPGSVVDYPTQRRVNSWMYQQLVRAMFSLDVRDTQVGMKLFRREVLDEVLPVVLVKRYAFDLEILAVARRFGVTRIAEAPIRLDYQFSGSGVNWRAILQALWDTAAVFYRLRLLRYYDRRRVLAHRLAVHRPEVPPSVTVVVTPGMDWPDARNRLERLLLRLPGRPVIVVRAPAQDITMDRPGVRVHHMEPGQDAADAVACAAATATTDIVAFIDLDSRPTRHWLDAALPLFGDPMVGAIAGPAVPVLTGNDRTDAAGVLSESRLGAAGARVRHHVGAVQEIGEFPLRNLFVRADAMRRLVSEGVALDDTFCAQIQRRLGLSVLCSPDVVVTTRPPALFRPYLGRLARLGRARGSARRRDGGLRARHVLPALFTVAAAAGPFAMRRPGRLRRAWLAAALVYTATLAWYGALLSLLHRRQRMSALAAVGAGLSHLAFGAGVLAGVVERVTGSRRRADVRPPRPSGSLGTAAPGRPRPSSAPGPRS
ncbi:MAG: glycosyltransferase [Thermoleophilia bacterium]|nr:glycosyltransferase [Thermoleophilia bacterium]